MITITSSRLFSVIFFSLSCFFSAGQSSELKENTLKLARAFYAPFGPTASNTALPKIWPGDFNKDGIANNVDLLYWGRAYEDGIGPIRKNASTDWYPQEGPDWNSEVNGVNKKHQDGNGDGRIDLLDVEVLQKNYGKSQDILSLGYETKSVAFQLKSIGYYPDSKEHRYSLSIESKGESVRLHGFACTFYLGNMSVDSVYFDTTGSSLQPTQFIQVYDSIANTLEIALTRMDGIDQLCEGPVGTFIIIMEDIPVFNADKFMPISVKDGGQMLAIGEFDAIASITLNDKYSDITRSSGDLLATASVVHESCDMHGSVSVDIEGGEPPYTIQWSTGATTPKVESLNPGNYSVTVQDAAGTQRQFSVEVKERLPLDYSSFGDCIEKIPSINIQSEKEEYTISNNLSHEIASENLQAENDYSIAIHSIKIYPNPAMANTWLSFYSSEAYVSKLWIFDNYGKRLGSLPINMSKGQNFHELDTSEFEKGMYYLELQTPKNRWQKKLVIIK